MNHDSFVIDADTLELVTDMLLIGLQACGEIERLRNNLGLCRLGGLDVPDIMHPIDPTGDAANFSRFADALRLTRHLPGAIEGAHT